jgi:4-alpha-glucanotransferase
VIYTPGTVNEANWTYRLARPIEDLEADTGLQRRFARIAQLASAHGRLG